VSTVGVVFGDISLVTHSSSATTAGAKTGTYTADLAATFVRIGFHNLAALRPVHTGDYSRRFRSPVLETVAELGDYSRQCRQCGQAIRAHFHYRCTLRCVASDSQR